MYYIGVQSSLHENISFVIYSFGYGCVHRGTRHNYSFPFILTLMHVRIRDTYERDQDPDPVEYNLSTRMSSRSCDADHISIWRTSCWRTMDTCVASSEKMYYGRQKNLVAQFMRVIESILSKRKATTTYRRFSFNPPTS